MISYRVKLKGPRKNKILSPFIVISLFKKVGFKEMNVRKFRNFVITEFAKSGIHYTDIKQIHRLTPRYLSDPHKHSGM